MQCPYLFYRILFYFLSLLSLTVEAVTANSELVGSTKGVFSVTPSGSASYSIPIQLPPNVGGVQPALALSYDSSAGNGLLGQGWALSGLSAISRCPTTLERDGFIDGVDFDSNDQFCLDGQRLVHISGNEYRTENDSFSKITGNEYGFTVVTPSGVKMYYGDTSNSQIFAQGRSKTMTWALRLVRDEFGNKYSIQYQNNGFSSGEFWPTIIAMGNHTSKLSHVSFLYDDRPDIIFGYIGGSKYQASKRLMSVNVFTKNNELVREYEIDYKPYIEPFNYSIIGSVNSCDRYGRCMDALELDVIESHTEGFESDTWPVIQAWNTSNYTWNGDFNGDGLTDIASAQAGNVYMKLSTGSGFKSETWAVTNAWGNQGYFWTGDFNGDGLTDIASARNGNIYVKLSTGSGFRSEVWSVAQAWNSPQYTWTGDFNGDGLTDIASAQAGNVYMKLSTGSGFKSETWAVTNAWGNQGYFWTGDFNGDGLTDIASARNGNIYVKLSTGSGFRSEVWSVAQAWNSPQYTWTGDFNGDGLTDIASAQAGNVYMKLSTGSGFKSETWAVTNTWGNQGYFWTGDFDGNGLTDIASARNGQIFLKLSTGKSFFSDTWNVTASWGAGEYTWAADYTGDGKTDIASALRGNIYMKSSVASLPVGTVTSFLNSLDSYVQVSLELYTSKGIYRKESLAVKKNKNANYPSTYDSVINVTPPSYAVSQVTQPDGVGGTTTTSYKYEGLRYDLYAKRSLGFAKTIIENPKTDIRSETSYNQNYPYIGMVTSTKTELMSSGQLLSNSTQSGFEYRDTSGKRTYFPYVKDSSETSYLLNDELLEVGTKTVSTKSSFNTSGQLTNQTITSTGSDGLGSFSVETTNEYTNGYSVRRQGEITRATVTSRAPGEAALTRTSSFNYDWSKGQLIKEVIEPGHSDPSVSRVSVYGYDAFGNRTSTVTCDGRYEYSCSTSASGARFSTVQFSADGLFATSATDALGYTTYNNYDARFGAVTSSTDINGLTSTFTYDSLGRKLTSKNPFNQTTTTTPAWCDYACPTIGGNEAYYKITTQAPNTPTKVVYFDQFNREIRKQTQGFNGELILVDTEYDDYGRVKRTSEPYFAGDTAYWNTPEYDALGRKKHVVTPNQDGTYDTTSTISYQGFTTEITDALGRTITEVKNVLGKVVKMSDKAQNDTLYEYDSLGNLTKTTDVAGNQVILNYDIRGRKAQMIDPDMGTWKYKYNTFDQLVEQTDAKNQKTVMVYDVMGRMTSRTDAYGTANAQTASWSYYTTPLKSRGKLYQKTAANGDYTRYSYNTTYGQLIQADQKIGSKIFTVKNAYNASGQLSSITYPGTTAYSMGLTVLRQYNQRGYLNRVYKNDGSVNYWTALSLSPRGQLEAVRYGNFVSELSAHSDANGWLIASQVYKGSNDLSDMTYEFDAVGNIVKRIDALQSDMTEAFNFDELDRLTHSTIYGGPSGVSHIDKFYHYDDMGNIRSKSDVGVYSYTGCGGRPHAVCNAGGTIYTYDANGSMIKGVKGSTTTQVGYTPFNKANHMQKGNYAVTFNYDADRNRNYKSRIQSGSLNLQTYYVGTSGKGVKIFEQEVSSTNGTKNIHYIYATGGQAVATHITEGTAKRTEYMHRDHLGSVALVTNDAGQVVSPANFDAFGKRRNIDWSDNATGTGLPTITGNIGFTGQESIPEIGLIHMNGRIYDPNLGRFLSADPLIQAPYNSQSYNRYSYVMNNPLSLIDPSGYSWVSKKWKSVKKFAKKNWSAVKFVATAYVFGPNAAVLSNKSFRHYVKTHKWSQQVASIGASIADYFGCVGACSSATSAYLTELNGGNFGDILKSAGIAYLSYAAFSAVNAPYGGNWEISRVIANGVTGGAVSMAHGGKFGDGATLSAGVAALTWAAQAMRSNQINDSLKYQPGDGIMSNSSGKSVGFMGDGFKLGGGRCNVLGVCGISPLGGQQGGQGSMFGLFDYAPGSVHDYIVEAFAGPHDFANSSFWYSSTGQSFNYTWSNAPFMKAFGEALNVINVGMVTPFVAASVTQPIMHSYYINHYQN